VTFSLLRRQSASLLIAALLLPLIVACGAPGSPAPTEPPLPTASIPRATEAPAPTTAPGATEAPAGEANTPAPLPTAPAAPAEVGFPIKLPDATFGVVSHLYYTDRERVLTLTEIAGFTWVRQQIQWKDIEGPEPKDYKWGELDNIVNDVSSRNIKLLISIVQSPTFYNPTNGLPQNPADMGDFVEALVQRYGTNISAIEIWNEQNLAVENGGRVTEEDAGHYVEILVESFKRIKAIEPSIIVLAGAPSSSGVNEPSLAVSDENYYRAMYSYKDGLIKDYFDAQAVHPGGAANPPDTLWPDNPSYIQGCQPAPDRCWNDDETHYFRHLENVRNFMVEEGVGDHQIWVTEYGWATPNDTPGYEFGNYVSQEQQRDYIIAAMQRAYNDYRYEDGTPWIGVMFLWNMNFAVLWGAQGEPNHEQASFGILNPDWSPRPAFLGIQGYLAELKAGGQ
jgi:polysaccharide biosynthesis protein PslG